MDFLDKIMKDMDKNKPPPVNKTDQAIIQSEWSEKIKFKVSPLISLSNF